MMISLFEAVSAKQIYDKYYAEEFPEKVYIRLLMIDPTAANTDSQDLEQIKKGKYTDWLVKQFLAKSEEDKLLMLNEDAESIYEALKLFIQLTKNKAGVENLELLNTRAHLNISNVKDINAYSTQSLRLLAATYEENKAQLQTSESDKEKDIELLFEDARYKVLIPLTHEAARKYGTGTSWCTATSNSNWFNNYTKLNDKHGPLVIIIDKTESGPNSKWQYHKESGQFMDYKDHRVGIYTFLVNQIRKGPAYEDSIDLVAEAIETRLQDDNWNYENITEEGTSIAALRAALAQGRTLSSDIIYQLIEDHQLTPELVSTLVNKFDYDFTIKDVTAAATTSQIAILSIILQEMGWSKQMTLRELLRTPLEWTNAYLIEYFVSDLSQSDAQSILNRILASVAGRRETEINLSQMNKVEDLVVGLLAILVPSPSLTEARRTLKTLSVEDILATHSVDSTVETILERFAQICKRYIGFFPKLEAALTKILNISSFMQQLPIWTSTSTEDFINDDFVSIRLHRQAYRQLESVGLKLDGSTLAGLFSKLLIGLHLTLTLQKTDTSDDRWAELWAAGVIQAIVANRAIPSGVSYLLGLFDIEQYDEKVLLTAIAKENKTVGYTAYLYDKYKQFKLGDITSDEVTLATDSVDFKTKTVAQAFEKAWPLSYASYKSIAKAVCLLIRSSHMDIHLTISPKADPIITGSESSMILADAIETLKQRRKAHA